MPQSANAVNDDGSSVTVGTTGTIGSLMTRELESMKQPEQTSSSAPRKQQTGPVSVPCGANPMKALQKRNHTSGCESSSNGGSSNGQAHGASDVPKHRHIPRRNVHQMPMLISDDAHKDRNLGTQKVEKKTHNYIVEVVDLKCSNPMSSRLKKLGFSKLSESTS